MSTKRGRPISAESNSLAVNQRRLKTRERVQRLRERQQANLSNPSQFTAVQLQQGDYVVELATTPEEEAAATLVQTGLRVEDIHLQQDETAAQAQDAAAPCGEHDILYDNSPASVFRQFARSRATAQPSTLSCSSSPSLPPISPQLPTQRSETAAAAVSASPTPLSPAVPPDSPFYDLVDVADDVVDSNSVIDSREKSCVANGNDIIESGEVVDATHTTYLPNTANIDLTQPGVVETDNSEHYQDTAVEHVVANAEEANEADADDSEENHLEYIVDKLYTQLVHGFHGCSDEKHSNDMLRHIEATPDNNHHSLGEVFSDAEFPSALPLADMITPEQLANLPATTATQWEAMFCGTSRLQPRPRNVCLHKEQTQAASPQVAYDIDSYLGFATSLAVARNGLFYNPIPRFKRNIQTDVHINATLHQTPAYVDADQPPRPTSIQLRHVPHFHLGHVHQAPTISIYVLFPHLPVLQEKFISLTQEQQTRWEDRVWLPALHRALDAHYMQHLPGGFDHASANSKAHQTELRQGSSTSLGGQRSIGYHLQPHSLEAIWSDVLHTVSTTAGLADFREPQLFFTAKGTKLEFKTNALRATLLQTMQHFDDAVHRALDFTHIDLDRLYVDVGKEICSPSSLSRTQDASIEDEPQVYVWKRCCLEQYMKWLYDDHPPKQGQAQQYFSQHFLRDASKLTTVTPKKSRHRKGGLIFSQFYSSFKEIFDATHAYPFCNDGLEEMALDPLIRRGAQQAAQGRRRDAKIIERGYLQSKRRVRDAIQGSLKKSFGIREEHRITWQLFKELQSWLEWDDNGDEPATSLPDCPSYAWPIRTTSYLDFVQRQTDKFATGFEVVRARCSSDFVTWEQTKIMAMFLRCLRFVLSGYPISRESSLWWSRRDSIGGDPPTERSWYGLGFCNTLPRYGYCWLEPRIDWNRLQFKLNITDSVLFGNDVLRGQYLRHGGQVRAFFDLTRQMDLALAWITQYTDIEAIRDRMIQWIVHLCLLQFRIDVLQCVRKEILPDRAAEALKGMQPFSYEALDEIMADGVYLMSGNRSDFKIVSYLGQFLCEFDDGRTRNHWDNRPFRAIYQRAVKGTKSKGRQVADRFQRCFWPALYRYHWVLPYPSPDALMQTTKSGARMWYSIQLRPGDSANELPPDIVNAVPRDWQWAKKSWRVGYPPALPEWLEWSRQEWEEWVAMRSGFRDGQAPRGGVEE